MRHLLLPTKIIGILWIIFFFIFPLQHLFITTPISTKEIYLLVVIDMLGEACIAFVYGHSRGKQGLNAGWIGKTFFFIELIRTPLFILGKDLLLGA